MTAFSNMRRMPQPGERWRLRRCQIDGPLTFSCGCTRTSEEITRDWSKHEGKVVTVLSFRPLAICPVCRGVVVVYEGLVWIDLIGDGFVSRAIPYTWLEPEDWRSPQGARP